MKHDLIKTDNYLLVVDESEIKGCYYDVYTRKVKHIDSAEYDKSVIPINIISHLPLNGSPILKGVDLLPPLKEDDVEKLAKMYCQEVKKEIENHSQHTRIGILGGSEVGFKQGYNKAKEKYKYTEEDLRKAFLKGVSVTREGYNAEYARDYEPNIECVFGEKADKFIQSLTQPKMPIGFECVMEKDFRYNDDGEPFGFKVHNSDKITTTTTPEGHTQWVGKYIYE